MPPFCRSHPISRLPPHPAHGTAVLCAASSGGCASSTCCSFLDEASSWPSTHLEENHLTGDCKMDSCTHLAGSQSPSRAPYLHSAACPTRLQGEPPLKALFPLFSLWLDFATSGAAISTLSALTVAVIPAQRLMHGQVAGGNPLQNGALWFTNVTSN